MHVDDITAALASRDMTAVNEAFMARANYPKQEALRRCYGRLQHHAPTTSYRSAE
jgi:hypothetical protein